MLSLKNQEKILEMIDKAFRVIASCETNDHITNALAYIGIVNKELRYIGKCNIGMELDGIYKFIGIHTQAMRTQHVAILERNKVWIKHYETIKLAILHKK